MKAVTLKTLCLYCARRNTTVSVKGDVDLTSYDRVLIGMPIWVEGPCAIGKALIQKYRNSLPSEAYYVAMHMGDRHDYLGKIKAMDGLLGWPSTGQISIRTSGNDYIKESADFAASLK